jgi:MFS family permease
MQRAAQQWILFQMTHSPFIVGLAGVCQFTPVLLTSLFTSVLADRFPKRNYLIVTQSFQMLQVMILFLLVWSGHLVYWHILLMAAFLGLANAFDMPARQSFFIELVGKESLKSAIGLNSTIVNIAKISGPALSGLILTAFGATLCFFINALSFVAVLVSLFFIKTYDVKVRIRSRDQSMMKEVLDGLKYISLNKPVREAVLMMLIVGVFAMNTDVTLPVFAQVVLKQKALGFSLLLSSIGIGSLLGALTFASKKSNLLGRHTLTISGIMLSLFLMITSLQHQYFIAFFSLMVIGFFTMIFMATVNSTIQLNTADEYRGRAMGVYALVFTGTTPIGNFITGIINQQFGSNIGFLFCGFMSLLMLLTYKAFLYRHRINAKKGTFSK